MLDREGKNNNDGSFDWKNAVIDAGIMSGLTFFTSLGAFHFVGVPTETTIIGGFISACGEFFLILAIKRGLREKGATA